MCSRCINVLFRENVVVAVVTVCRLREWRLVCCKWKLCYLSVNVKVEGVGQDGRMFMLTRPSEAEQISTLWGLYHQAEKDKAQLKARLDFQVSVI